uniref:Uncharacterized protein n=1 Tax=Meloidogyne enterolobii TaxID=390850 RepID=A0A6V7UNP7_MELEN|nr:unnamed protein product [Meloidogyne enterolobii]
MDNLLWLYSMRDIENSSLVPDFEKAMCGQLINSIEWDKSGTRSNSCTVDGNPFLSHNKINFHFCTLTLLTSP